MPVPTTTERQHSGRRRGPAVNERELTVSWGTNLEAPGLRALVVECRDELTQLLFYGPPIMDETDPEAIVAGPFAELAINAHRARCESCQAWAARWAS